MGQHKLRLTLGFSILSCAAIAVFVGCDGDSESKTRGPCARSELDGCGVSCVSTGACEPGLHCNESRTCDAECSADAVITDCGSERACTEDGRCVPSDSPLLDAGGNGSGGGSDGNGGSTGNVCADVSLKATITKPNVVLIVDQSFSMNDPFDNSTRWLVLKNALLSDTGLVAELQNVVQFGIVLYTYDEQKDATCPVLTPSGLTVALNNLAAIRSIYMPAEPGDNTPTGESVEAVLAEVNRLGLTAVDAVDPTIFILATDGNPDTCALPDQGAFNSMNSRVATKRSVDAVKKAFAQNVRTFVIAVAGEADLAQSHVNDLANAGVGDPAAPGVKSAPSYRVNNDKGLRDALRTIVTGELSCDVKLEGKVVGDPCKGVVTLGGNTLACNDSAGWALIDESTIQLRGSACDALKTGQVLNASFPCDVVILQ